MSYKEIQVVDSQTGEVIDHTIEHTKHVKHEEFMQVYIDDVATLLGATSKGESQVLLMLYKLSTYANDATSIGNEVQITAATRDKIIKATGLKDGTIKNIIVDLTKKGLLIRNGTFKTSYFLNPKYFFKGPLHLRNKCYKLSLKYVIIDEPNYSDND